MEQAQQIQQLQNQIATLKIRTFDAQEQVAAFQSQLKEQTSMMQQIVDELRVPGDEEGNVSYEAVIDYIKGLVHVPPVEETTPEEQVVTE